MLNNKLKKPPYPGVIIFNFLKNQRIVIGIETLIFPHPPWRTASDPFPVNTREKASRYSDDSIAGTSILATSLDLS